MFNRPPLDTLNSRLGAAWLLTGLERFTRSFAARPGLVVGTGGIPLTEFLARPAQDWV
jgi:hypothetical protein